VPRGAHHPTQPPPPPALACSPRCKARPLRGGLAISPIRHIFCLVRSQLLRRLNRSVLPGHTRSHSFLPASTRFYPLLPASTRSYPLLPASTRFYPLLPVPTRSYSHLPLTTPTRRRTAIRWRLNSIRSPLSAGRVSRGVRRGRCTGGPMARHGSSTRSVGSVALSCTIEAVMRSSS
jgi:hypothetical protein